MSRRVERGRRSAKQTIIDFADELQARPRCEATENKLMALQTIALRMNWNDLYTKLRYRGRPPELPADEVPEPKERWWDK